MKAWSKLIAGIFLCLAGVALGLYVGGWICFVGGIKQIVFAVQQHPIPPVGVAVGVLKIMVTGLCGYVSAAVLIIPGVVLFRSA